MARGRGRPRGRGHGRSRSRGGSTGKFAPVISVKVKKPMSDPSALGARSPGRPRGKQVAERERASQRLQANNENAQTSASSSATISMGRYNNDNTNAFPFPKRRPVAPQTNQKSPLDLQLDRNRNPNKRNSLPKETVSVSLKNTIRRQPRIQLDKLKTSPCATLVDFEEIIPKSTTTKHKNTFKNTPTVYRSHVLMKSLKNAQNTSNSRQVRTGQRDPISPINPNANRALRNIGNPGLTGPSTSESARNSLTRPKEKIHILEEYIFSAPTPKKAQTPPVLVTKRLELTQSDCFSDISSDELEDVLETTESVQKTKNSQETIVFQVCSDDELDAEDEIELYSEEVDDDEDEDEDEKENQKYASGAKDIICTFDEDGELMYLERDANGDLRVLPPEVVAELEMEENEADDETDHSSPSCSPLPADEDLKEELSQAIDNIEDLPVVLDTTHGFNVIQDEVEIVDFVPEPESCMDSEVFSTMEDDCETPQNVVNFEEIAAEVAENLRDVQDVDDMIETIQDNLQITEEYPMTDVASVVEINNEEEETCEETDLDPEVSFQLEATLPLLTDFVNEEIINEEVIDDCSPVSDVQVEPEPEVDTKSEPEVEAEHTVESDADVDSEPEVELEHTDESDPEIELEPEIKLEAEVEAEPDDEPLYILNEAEGASTPMELAFVQALQNQLQERINPEEDNSESQESQSDGNMSVDQAAAELESLLEEQNQCCIVDYEPSESESDVDIHINNLSQYEINKMVLGEGLLALPVGEQQAVDLLQLPTDYQPDLVSLNTQNQEEDKCEQQIQEPEVESPPKVKTPKRNGLLPPIAGKSTKNKRAAHITADCENMLSEKSPNSSQLNTPSPIKRKRRRSADTSSDTSRNQSFERRTSHEKLLSPLEQKMCKGYNFKKYLSVELDAREIDRFSMQSTKATTSFQFETTGSEANVHEPVVRLKKRPKQTYKGTQRRRRKNKNKKKPFQKSTKISEESQVEESSHTDTALHIVQNSEISKCLELEESDATLTQESLTDNIVTNIEDVVETKSLDTEKLESQKTQVKVDSEELMDIVESDNTNTLPKNLEENEVAEMKEIEVSETEIPEIEKKDSERDKSFHTSSSVSNQTDINGDILEDSYMDLGPLSSAESSQTDITMTETEAVPEDNLPSESQKEETPVETRKDFNIDLEAIDKSFEKNPEKDALETKLPEFILDDESVHSSQFVSEDEAETKIGPKTDEKPETETEQTHTSPVGNEVDFKIDYDLDIEKKILRDLEAIENDENDSEKDSSDLKLSVFDFDDDNSVGSPEILSQDETKTKLDPVTGELSNTETKPKRKSLTTLVDNKVDSIIDYDLEIDTKIVLKPKKVLADTLTSADNELSISANVSEVTKRNSPATLPSASISSPSLAEGVGNDGNANTNKELQQTVATTIKTSTATSPDKANLPKLMKSSPKSSRGSDSTPVLENSLDEDFEINDPDAKPPVLSPQIEQVKAQVKEQVKETLSPLLAETPHWRTYTNRRKIQKRVLSPVKPASIARRRVIDEVVFVSDNTNKSPIVINDENDIAGQDPEVCINIRYSNDKDDEERDKFSVKIDKTEMPNTSVNESKMESLDVASLYNLGDIVMARLGSYCFWPCMITYEPDLKVYYKLSGKTHNFHVRFFGDNGRRAWVSKLSIIKYNGPETLNEYHKKLAGKISKALRRDRDACKVSATMRSAWELGCREAELLLTKSVAEKHDFFFKMFASQHEKEQLVKSERKRKRQNTENEEFVIKHESEIKQEKVETPVKPVLKKVKVSEHVVRDLHRTAPVFRQTARTPRTYSNKRPRALRSGSATTPTSKSVQVTPSVTPPSSTPKTTTTPETPKTETKKNYVIEDLEMIMKGLGKSEPEDKQSDKAMEKPNLERETKKKSPDLNENNLKLVDMRTLRLRSQVDAVSVSETSDTKSDSDSMSKLSVQSSVNKRVLFKDVSRLPVCHICCESTRTVLKCKGCCGFYHPECSQLKEELKEEPKDEPDEVFEGENNQSSVEIVNVKTKSKYFNEQEINLNDSDSILPNIYLLEQLDQKLQKVMAPLTATTNYHNSTTDSSSDENTLGLAGLGFAFDADNFLCMNCKLDVDPPCFACSSTLYLHQLEERYRCSINGCGKYYHKGCLKCWPQAILDHASKEMSFKCPMHNCHNCISENPHACNTTLPLTRTARCLRCPATYHINSFCIPAGTVIHSQTQVTCPRHVDHRGKRYTINANWCFICSRGGDLLCCETCPTSVHQECISINLRPDDSFVCEDCESGRLPLHDEIVWAKFAHYKWWPAVTLFPEDVPENVRSYSHKPGEFVIKFYGTHDYQWIGLGRVFLFQEDDRGETTLANRKDLSFQKAIDEARSALICKKELKKQRDLVLRKQEKPPAFQKIRVNKYIGNLKPFDGNVSSANACGCSVSMEHPCGPDTDCINRLLMTECDPEVCPARDKCLNQRFEKRTYPPLLPIKTETRGWGLVCTEKLTKGQFIIEYVGDVIDNEEYQRRNAKMNEQKIENYYFLTIDCNRIIDAGPRGNVARFMNHCCKPNCETQKWTVNGETRIGLFALEEIPPNNELTFNYKLETVGDRKKICHCGAENCSGFLGVKQKESAKKSSRTKSKAKHTKKPPVQKPQARDVKEVIEVEKVTVRSRARAPQRCFICSQIKIDIACTSKNCGKSFHYKCLEIYTKPQGKWVCPRHFCNVCTSRTIRSCMKCLESYCGMHSFGHIMYNKALGYLCNKHNPEVNPELKSQSTSSLSSHSSSPSS